MEYRVKVWRPVFCDVLIELIENTVSHVFDSGGEFRGSWLGRMIPVAVAAGQSGGIVVWLQSGGAQLVAAKSLRVARSESRVGVLYGITPMVRGSNSSRGFSLPRDKVIYL
jgi:hypothetical protein